MAATLLKNVGMGQQQAGKVSGSKKKQLEEHIATNHVTGNRSVTLFGIFRKEHLREAESLRNRAGQSFSPLQKRKLKKHYKLWSNFRIMFFNVKL